ncbi:MAG: undecaprenyldiphospho-muramoylpentapeptide beta-N-acetylglucosaminyltransferase [Candidatus Tenebribacter burtonii]|nr:undecaprenyldiphospho-muramoylpentapeptide beta-N-acetylglucosaminyltransferase [Candidatus Tenebribacter burtonii]
MGSKKVVIAAGGTGGHIIPALSIATELIKAGVQVLYVGNKNSMEQKLTFSHSINFAEINVQKFYRKLTFAHIKFPFKLIKSILDSKIIIRKFDPDAFLGTGGFVSGPVGYAAHLLKIPIFLQEQNSFPGATTKILSKYSKMIFLGNKNANKYFPNNKTIYTGNPINQNAVLEKDTIDYIKLGLKPDTKKIFLFGGSQGSVILNNTFLPIIDDLLALGYEVIWQIGKYSFEEFYPKVKGKKGVYAFDFTNEIGKIYNSVDLAIARAGALSLAELETKKIPSILIPLPSATENHQYYNAMELKEKRVAEIIEQKSLNSDELKEMIVKMLQNIDKIKKHFTSSIHADAPKNIAKEIIGFLS